jgi:hypothetical protein
MEFEGASNGNTDAMIEDILPSKLKKKKQICTWADVEFWLEKISNHIIIIY